MSSRWLLSIFTVASFAVAQTPKTPAADIPESQLESAHQANPDDAMVTGRLLRYYERENRDSTGAARLALLSWEVEHHPDSPLFGMGGSNSLPKSLRDQLKPLWIAQVQRHPDNPQILRNAAAAFENAPTSIRVGANVQNSNLTRQVKPEYPQEARNARVQGTVRLSATIGPGGDIQSLQLVSGHPLLVQSAITAVKQWLYQPTLLNGNPVTVITTIDVDFTL